MHLLVRQFTWPQAQTRRQLPTRSFGLLGQVVSSIVIFRRTQSYRISTLFRNLSLSGNAYRGVFAHFNGRFPAAKCDLLVKEALVKLVGAQYTDEVVCMNGLSVNIHLLLISFYRPTATRYKIVIEGHAFPSDRVL